MANGTNGDAAVPVIDKTAPGYQLLPGDLGYAPPARIAPRPGVLTAEELGHIGSGHTSLNVQGAVPLAMPAPAPATISSDTASTRPSQLTAGQVNAQFDKAIGDLTAWILDISSPLEGKRAVVAQFFRDLEARQRARGTAATLGRLVEPDQVDQATSSPPPEFFQLRHAAQLIVAVTGVYQEALGKHGIGLGVQEQTMINGILAELEPLLPLPPAVPEVVPEADTKSKAEIKAEAKAAAAEAKAAVSAN